MPSPRRPTPPSRSSSCWWPEVPAWRSGFRSWCRSPWWSAPCWSWSSRSYRQTIFAYPGGGGSYIVSRENLGRYPSLVAAAALMIDYVLTVAVSISAGVAAIVSLPALRGLASHRVVLCLIAVAVITVANLRGVKQSGALFAVPTYAYIVLMASSGRLRPDSVLCRATSNAVPFDPKRLCRGPPGRRHPRPVPPAEGLLVGRHRPHRRGGHLQRRAGLPAARAEECGHHPGLDGDHPRQSVHRCLAARQPSPSLPERQSDGHLRARAGRVRYRTDLRRCCRSPPPPS